MKENEKFILEMLKASFNLELENKVRYNKNSIIVYLGNSRQAKISIKKIV